MQGDMQTSMSYFVSPDQLTRGKRHTTRGIAGSHHDHHQQGQRAFMTVGDDNHPHASG